MSVKNSFPVLEHYQKLAKQRRLTDKEFTKLLHLKVKQQNSHEYSDAYDGGCDHCLKMQLCLSQMTFGVTTSI